MSGPIKPVNLVLAAAVIAALVVVGLSRRPGKNTDYEYPAPEPVATLEEQFQHERNRALETVLKVVQSNQARSFFVARGNLETECGTMRQVGEDQGSFLRRHRARFEEMSSSLEAAPPGGFEELIAALESAATDPAAPEAFAGDGTSAVVRMRLSAGGLHVIPYREPFVDPVSWADGLHVAEVFLDREFPHDL